MFKKLPIRSLCVSAKNVRTIVEDDDPALAANIEAVGLISPLTVERVGSGKYEITAGQLRYRAILQLVASGTSKRFPDENATVECRINETEEQIGDMVDISLSENLHRKAMHPIDEFKAFARLVEEGMSPEKVALRHGVAERYVLQRMKLSRLSEKVLAAFQAGQIRMEMAEAMTVTDDHERQDNLLATLLAGSFISAAGVRQNLMSETVNATSSLGQFVLERYRAEGLRESSDLFSEHVWLDDAAGVERIACALLDEKAQGLKADGWKWVHTAFEYPWGFIQNVEFSHPDPDLDGEDYEEDAAFPLERRAELGCIVYLERGSLRVLSGAVLEERNEVEEGEDDEDALQPANGNEDSAGGQAVSGYSRALIDTLSVHRTRALQRAISKDRSAGLSLLLFNLYLGVDGRTGLYYSPSNIQASAAHAISPEVDENRVNRAEEELKQKVDSVNLPVEGYLSMEQAVDLFDRIHALSDDEKLDAIILYSALSVNAPMVGGTLPVSGMAEHIGALLKVDVAEAWRPDGDFLKRTPMRLIAEGIPLGNGHQKLSRLKKDGVVKTLGGWFASPDQVTAAELGYENEIPADVRDTLATWLPAGMAFLSADAEELASDETVATGDAGAASIAA